jgi:hypothetical protein
LSSFSFEFHSVRTLFRKEQKQQFFAKSAFGIDGVALSSKSIARAEHMLSSVFKYIVRFLKNIKRKESK